jgi:hypothetical protein
MDKKNNTGIDNSGDWNGGDCNSGDWNGGDCNSGDCNSGDCNSGDLNSGDRNSGDWNGGDCNSGDCNSGDWNSGDWNGGDCNSGDCNSGDCNSGDRNSGYFNTNSPDKIRIFNTWVDMTHGEFNQKHNIYMDIPLNRWINKEDMTDTEKNEVKGWETMGGYLKTLPFKEACQIWWNENPDRHDDFLNLPNFNPEIFKEITGIDTQAKTTLSDDELIAELERRGKVKQGKIIN